MSLRIIESIIILYKTVQYFRNTQKKKGRTNYKKHHRANHKLKSQTPLKQNDRKIKRTCIYNNRNYL